MIQTSIEYVILIPFMGFLVRCAHFFRLLKIGQYRFLLNFCQLLGLRNAIRFFGYKIQRF
ncbi:hypothetical protein EMIT0P218_30119 [Pseudomonas sp. IT-P218]